MAVKKIFIVIIGLLLDSLFSSAYADAPNYYECKGKNISVTFNDHSSIGNTSLLTVNLGKEKYSTEGGQY